MKLTLDSFYGDRMYKGQLPPTLHGRPDRITRQCYTCGNYVDENEPAMKGHLLTHRGKVKLVTKALNA